ncbi:MAG: TlpA disulfide reductase family protein [Bacteroidota bacterium]
MKSPIILAIILLISFTSFAQEYDFIDKNLKRKTIQELGGKINLGSGMSYFLENGDKLELSSLKDYLGNANYKPAFFLDNQNNIKTIVFEEASEEEIAKAKALQEERALAGQRTEVGKEMIPFSITDMDGNKISLADQKGKVIVLNFWFIACKPCVMEMPHLNKFVEKYQDDDVLFLAIANDEKTQIERFLEKKKFDYTIAPDGKRVASDWGVSSFPTNIIIDKEGNIAYSMSGYGSHMIPLMEKKIEELLND